MKIDLPIPHVLWFEDHFRFLAYNFFHNVWNEICLLSLGIPVNILKVKITM